MLTEEAKAIADLLATPIKIGMLVFIGYALTNHMPWTDAVALTFVLVFTWRALAGGSRRSTEA